MAHMKVSAQFAGASESPGHVMAWEEIVEWQVCDDSDGPPFYRLIETSGGFVAIGRPSDAATEQNILDFVRSVGGRPVRLFCDIS